MDQVERNVWIGKPSTRVFIILVIIPVVGWVLIPWYLLYWRFRTYTISTEKVYAKKGLAGTTQEMDISEIADVSIERGITLRILGMGTLVFRSRGGGKVIFDTIGNPEDIKNMIHKTSQLIRMGRKPKFDDPFHVELRRRMREYREKKKKET